MTVLPAVIAEWSARVDARVESAAAALEGRYRGVEVYAGNSPSILDALHEMSLQASPSWGYPITLHIIAKYERGTPRLCADVRWETEHDDEPALVSTFDGFADATWENLQRVEDDLPRLIDTLTAAIELRTPRFETGGKDIFEIDGRDFDTREGFHEVFGRVVGTGSHGRSFDAFNDVLRGGFGSPKGGFVLRWTNSTISRVTLGHGAMVTWLEQIVHTCHPSNVESVKARIAAARRFEGPTIFDMIVEILRDHGPGGSEAEDGVVLELA